MITHVAGISPDIKCSVKGCDSARATYAKSIPTVAVLFFRHTVDVGQESCVVEVVQSLGGVALYVAKGM